MSREVSITNSPEVDREPSTRESAVRLLRTFDVERLEADLERLAHHIPSSQGGPYHDGQWKGIALVNRSGVVSEASSAFLGTGVPTEAFHEASYLAEILDGIGAPVQSARILSLPAGASIGEHTDQRGLSQGTVRLHVPIQTHPDVIITIDDRPYHWAPGEFWFGDFSQKHSVRNVSSIERIHLVIDCNITPKLLELFPPGFLDEETVKQVTLTPDPCTMPTFVRRQMVGYFDVPGGFTNRSAYRIVAQNYEQGEELHTTVVASDFSSRWAYDGHSSSVLLAVPQAKLSWREVDGSLQFALVLPPPVHSNRSVEIPVVFRSRLGLQRRLLVVRQWLLRLIARPYKFVLRARMRRAQRARRLAN